MSAARRHIATAAMLALLCGLASAAAHAIDFRSAIARTIAYDAPSEQARRLLVLRPGTPVEIVSVDNSWVRVREPGGTLNWVRQDALSEQRTLLVNAERALIRREAREDAAPVFAAVRNVVLQRVEAPQFGWIKVRHADGDEGYIRVGEVWGL